MRTARKNKYSAPPPFKKSAGKRPRASLFSPHGEERFLLENLLGSGEISETYAALDLRRVEWGDTNPRVAIKRPSPKLSGDMRAGLALTQEFCVLRHLAHPGVVRAFDLHREPFGMCFSMELLEGRTAYKMLAEQPSGLGGAVAPFALALFDALSFLHSHGVVHGDIKPSNIFLCPEGRITLIDFNVATATAQLGAACSSITRGLKESLYLPSYSLCYAGPERLKGEHPSTRDDVFAACCTVCEMTDGRHPFKRRSSLEAMEAKIIPERPRGLTRLQWATVRRGLSFDPALRPTADLLRVCFGQGFLHCVTKLLPYLTV